MSKIPPVSDSPEATTIEIKSRYTGAVLFAAKVTDLRKAVILACQKGINLCGADLGGAYLDGADLCGADLCGANLADANLHGVNLGGANLCGIDLCGADLSDADLGGANLHGANLGGANLDWTDLCGADLGGANFSGANLGGANLYGTDLYGAHLGGANLCGVDLDGAIINWSSHALVLEILRQVAGSDVEKRSFVGLVATSCDWSWLQSAPLPLFKWAVAVLAPYIDDDDNAPEILMDAVANLAVGYFPKLATP